MVPHQSHSIRNPFYMVSHLHGNGKGWKEISGQTWKSAFNQSYLTPILLEIYFKVVFLFEFYFLCELEIYLMERIWDLNRLGLFSLYVIQGWFFFLEVVSFSLVTLIHIGLKDGVKVSKLIGWKTETSM